ncbi:MAG: hypothetical protein WC718_09550 [Phycisphaerales bacterium]
MKTIVNIHLHELTIGTELFNNIAAIAPAWVDEHPTAKHARAMYIDHDETLPEVRGILKTLADAGYYIHIAGWSQDSTPSKTISVLHTRRFDERDIEAAELLSPSGGRIYYSTRNQRQILCLAENESESQADLRHVRDFAMAGKSLVCSSKVRRALESAGLKVLDFRPTTLMPRSEKRQFAGEVEDWSKYGEPWWQLWSEIVLPWAAPSRTKRDPRTYEVLPRETVNKFVFMDDGYTDSLWRYLRLELVPLGAFDIARTPEWHPFPWVIVSQRFRQVVREQGFQCNFRPVFIEDDVDAT